MFAGALAACWELGLAPFYIEIKHHNVIFLRDGSHVRDVWDLRGLLVCSEPGIDAARLGLERRASQSLLAARH